MTTTNFNAPITVLLVEDDMDSGESVKSMLTRRGVIVKLVPDAEAALTEFHTSQYDAIVADIRLPKRSGVDLLRDVRGEYPDFPFILLTGFDSLNTALQAVRLGAQDYILKPLDNIDILLEPLQKAVREYRMILRNQLLERDLRRSEARFRAVVENSQDVAYHFNFKNKSLDYLSPSVESVLGVSEQTVRGLTMMQAVDLLHPDDQMRVLNILLALTDMLVAGSLDAELPRAPIEFRVRHADGTYRWLSVAQSVVFGEAGRDPAALVGIARDVTAQKNAEARESQLQARSERISRMEAVSALAGGVAHDLNNNLCTMLTMPGLVLEDLERRGVLKEVPAVRDDLAVLMQAAERAGVVVQDLLTLSRRGGQRFAKLSINTLVEDVLGSADWSSRRQAFGSRLVVHTRLEPGLRDIQGSVANLHRVLFNLVVNALEAMPSGGVIEVETCNETVAEERLGYEVIPPGEYAVLRVRDTGVGMARTQMEQLFEPFHSSKQMGPNSGSGLGLAIVHGILKDHHGVIDVVSKQDSGTTFSLYFPVSPATQAQEPEAIVSLDGTGRVLLVEDQRDLLTIGMRVLRKYGYEVVGVSTPKDAIDAFRESCDRDGNVAGSTFDLVILDMIMKGGDGLDVYRDIVARCPGQKCLVVSGYSESGRVKEAMALGAGAFLQKPFTVEQLGRAVRDIMTERRPVSLGSTGGKIGVSKQE